MSTDIILTQQQNVAAIAQQAPQAFTLNRQSHDNCIAAGQKLLEQIETSGMTEELDQRAALYIEKSRKTVKKMNEQRAPVTKLFDEIRSVFTSLEGDVDPSKPASVPGRLQQLRNEYATRRRAEEEARRREEERRQRKQMATDKYRADLEADMKQTFNRYINVKFNDMQQLVNALTIENYDESRYKLEAFTVSLPDTYFEENKPLVSRPLELEPQEASGILSEAIAKVKPQFSEQYNFEMVTNRDDLLDLLPSKLRELQAIAKAGAEEAERRKAEMQQREAEEARRREEERRRKEEAERQQAEMQQKQAEMGGLFAAAQAGMPAYTPKTQVKKKVVVNDPRGFLDLLNLWWLNEGCTLSVDELGKKLKFAITLAEKQANDKNKPHTIESPYISYVDDVKAK